MKIVIVTGGFDPVHSGHIEYFKAAAALGDRLWVGVNSDEWLSRKKGRPFMPIEERTAIIEALSVVDCVFEFDDSDDTAVGAIRQVREQFPDAEIVFANGGDRQKGTTPEVEYAKELIEEGKIVGIAECLSANYSTVTSYIWSIMLLRHPEVTASSLKHTCVTNRRH